MSWTEHTPPGRGPSLTSQRGQGTVNGHSEPAPPHRRARVSVCGLSPAHCVPGHPPRPHVEMAALACPLLPAASISPGDLRPAGCQHCPVLPQAEWPWLWAGSSLPGSPDLRRILPDVPCVCASLPRPADHFHCFPQRPSREESVFMGQA